MRPLSSSDIIVAEVDLKLIHGVRLWIIVVLCCRIRQSSVRSYSLAQFFTSWSDQNHVAEIHRLYSQLHIGIQSHLLFIKEIYQ